MRVWSLLILTFVVAGCQVAAGTASLGIRAEPELAAGVSGKMEDLGGAGASGHEEMGGAGVGGVGGVDAAGGPATGGMHAPTVVPCEDPAQLDCDWNEQCGCEKDKHCQARGADLKPTCVMRGARELGQKCKSPDDCKEGTCDLGVCRDYCKDSCDGGKCVPASGEDGKPLSGVNVCWPGCQVEDLKSCSNGLTCQVRDSARGKGPFCFPPADPCPTVEDGKCDEPRLCASGTDSVDCSCKKSKPEAECDLAAQCGCPKGKSCKAVGSGGATPTCVDSGTLEMGAVCEKHEECGPGLSCLGSLCKPYCDLSTKCPGEGDKCVPVQHRTASGSWEDIPGVNACMLACNADHPCKAANTACMQLASYGGSFCVECTPEVTDGKCGLVSQCGCAPGLRCALSERDDKSLSTSCFPATGPVLPSGACASAQDCKAGSFCDDHVCRKYCTGKSDCAGTCIAITGLGADLSVGVCLDTCSSSPNQANSCGPNTTCAPHNVDGATMMSCKFVPLTTNCPTNNKKCDEPKGTGLCAAGYDTVDCMGATP